VFETDNLGTVLKRS